MLSNQKLKSIKWVSIIGSILNIVLLGFLIYGLAVSINGIEELASLNNNMVTEDVLAIYKTHQVFLYLTVIDIVFSLLLISSSVRIDQIFYRLKWVNILCSSFSLAITLGIFFVCNKFSYSEFAVHIGWPLYVLLGLAILAMLVDVVVIRIKYRNNPFYHNGQFKKTYTSYTDVNRNYNQPVNNDRDIVYEDKTQTSQKVEQEVVDELANLSYFERYQKRSEELQKVDEDFDAGKISEQEYQKRRRDIYAKYDKYN